MAIQFAVTSGTRTTNAGGSSEPARLGEKPSIRGSPAYTAALRMASAEPGVAGTALAEGEPGVGPDRAEAQVVVPGDDGKSVAAEERQTGLRQDLKRLVEGRRFVDGDGSVDQLALVRDPGPGRARRHALDACAHRFRIETCMTTIGIGLRNLYP